MLSAGTTESWEETVDEEVVAEDVHLSDKKKSVSAEGTNWYALNGEIGHVRSATRVYRRKREEREREQRTRTRARGGEGENADRTALEQEEGWKQGANGCARAWMR